MEIKSAILYGFAVKNSRLSFFEGFDTPLNLFRLNTQFHI